MRPPPTRLRRFGECLSIAGLLAGFVSVQVFVWNETHNLWAFFAFILPGLFGAMAAAIPGGLIIAAADRRLAKKLGVRWLDVQPKYPRAKAPPFPKW